MFIEKDSEKRGITSYLSGWFKESEGWGLEETDKMRTIENRTIREMEGERGSRRNKSRPRMFNQISLEDEGEKEEGWYHRQEGFLGLGGVGKETEVHILKNRDMTLKIKVGSTAQSAERCRLSREEQLNREENPKTSVNK